MIIWIDAHLSSALAAWINRTHTTIEAKSASRLGLHRASDKTIFEAARKAGAVIMSKDADFLKLVERLGIPPQILWITRGNTSNTRMRAVFEKALVISFRTAIL